MPVSADIASRLVEVPDDVASRLVEVDAPHNTVLDERNSRVVTLPQTLNNHETKFTIDKDVDGKKGFLGQEHVGELPPSVPGTPRSNIMWRAFMGSVSSFPRISAGMDLSEGQAMQSGERSIFQGAEDYANERGGGGIMAPMSADEAALSKATGDQLVLKSRELIAKNKQYLIDAGYTTEDADGFGDQLAVAVGGGVPSVTLSIGAFMATKNPMLAAAISTALMAPQQYSESYIEADEAKGERTPAEKRAIAGSITALNVPLEFIGDKFLFKSVMGNTAVKRVASGFIAEGMESGSQQLVESGITNATGVRDQKPSDVFRDIATQTIAGGILGGLSSGTVGAFGEKEAKAQGVPDDVAAEFGKYLKENYPAAHEDVGEFVDKELSPLASEPENAAKYVEIMQKLRNNEPVNPDEFSPEDRAVYDEYTKILNVPQQQADGEQAPAPEPKIAELETALADTGLSTEQAQTAVGEFASSGDVDVSAYDAALQGRVQNVLKRFGQDRAPIAKGRIKNLDTAIEAKLTEIDLAEEQLGAAQREGRGTKRLESARDKLFSQWEAMDEERADLLTSTGKPIGKEILGKDVTVKGQQIEGERTRSRDEAARQVNAAFREARTATRDDVKGIQKRIIESVRNSGMSQAQQSEFIEAITNTQTAAQLRKAAPKIQQRIESKLAEANRKATISDIKETLSQVKNSDTIAIDYVKQIEEMFDDIDLTNRTKSTTDKLNATLDHMKRTGQEMPEKVIEKLQRLNKRQIKEIPTEELKDILDDMRQMVKQGKTKLKLMEVRRQRVKQQRLKELAADTVPVSQRDLETAPLGEKLRAVDKFKNMVREGMNKVQRFNLYKNPMDVIFDILDGSKQYKGANSRIFKRGIDSAFGNYLQLKESATREIKNFQDKHGFTYEQQQKIGAYAAAQQEDGIKKLVNSGYTEAEIKAIKLTPEEMKLYEMMRNKLDSMVPQLKEIMRTVYNKDFTEVKNYFPFMTDFDAMQGVEIQDMFGDAVPVLAQKKNVEKGFTKSREGAGKQKIRIDAMGVFLRHVDNASYLVEMGQTVRDLSDVALSDQYRDMAGELGQRSTADWLNLIARKGNMQGGYTILDTLRRNAGAAVLGFKLSSVLVQPTSLMDGASLLGGNHVASGIGKVASREWREFLINNVPEIRERAGDDVAFLDMGGHGTVAKAREAGMYALQKLDVLSASAVAIGAYEKAVQAKGGEVDLSKPDADAIQFAQLMVRRTQSSSFAKDAAPIISQGKFTGNVSVDKLIFQFQSFMLNRWSLIQHDMIEAGIAKGRSAQALNIATWLTLANLSEYFVRHWTKEMLAVVLNSEPPKEDDPKEAVIQQTISNIPVVSTLVNAAGYGSSPVPSASLLEKTFEEMSYGVKAKSADKKQRHYASAAILLGGLFGLPAALQVQQVQSQLMKTDKKK